MTTAPGPVEDPGWGGFGRGLLVVFLPGYLKHEAGREGGLGSNPLVALRGIFLAFTFAPVLIGAVAVLVDELLGEPAVAPSVMAPVVAAFGVLTLVAPMLISRPLSCADDATLGATYRMRFFLRIAFASSAALMGFVGVRLSTEAWVYALGLVFAAIGPVRLAPTRASIERDQEALNLEGCGRSLLVALQMPGPAGKGTPP